MPRNPEMPIGDLFEEKARSGDGSYAIAFALLKLADVQEAARATRSTAGWEQMRGLNDVAEAIAALSMGIGVELSGKVETGE